MCSTHTRGVTFIYKFVFIVYMVFGKGNQTNVSEIGKRGAEALLKKSKEELSQIRIKSLIANNKNKKDKILKCKKCNKEYQIIVSDYSFNKGKYKKHCSRNCANSRIRTKEIKLKISNSKKEYDKLNPIKKQYTERKCPICGKIYKRTPCIKRKTCGKNDCIRKYLSKVKEKFPERNKYKQVMINGKRTKQHRVSIEKHMNVKLGYNDVVHHKNGILSDNRIENLQLMTRGEHTVLHNKLRKKKALSESARVVD